MYLQPKKYMWSKIETQLSPVSQKDAALRALSLYQKKDEIVTCQSYFRSDNDLLLIFN